MQMVLPMNTGAEAVETAMKAVRRWGYTHKHIPRDEAEIIVCENNFHGRTTTITGFSSEPLYRDGFGPFTPGFVSVPFGDIDALEAAITPRTCALLIEPIQCEAGILIPPDGYLRQAAELCARERVLLVADEIQTGLGRTGRMFACQHENVQPDVYVLGKALSGGVYPVSAVVSSSEILGVFRPGSHGSTYGGNPLACAVARAALRVIEEERLADRSAELGAWLLYELRKLRHPHIKAIRGRGLLIGIELLVPARSYCERLKESGAAVQGDARFRDSPGPAADHLGRGPGVGGGTGAQGVRGIARALRMRRAQLGRKMETRSLSFLAKARNPDRVENRLEAPGIPANHRRQDRRCCRSFSWSFAGRRPIPTDDKNRSSVLPHRRRTARFGSSVTRSGGCFRATLNGAGSLPHRTHCVVLLPPAR